VAETLVSPADDRLFARILAVKPDEVREHIEQAARRFNAELHTESYAETHSDSAQLRRLLSLLSPRGKQVFLDLGTGNGYVGMALAKEHPTSRVVGVDIAEQAIEQDVKNAKQQGLSNVHFRAFDGVTLPFSDGYFDGAVCRYAFHHLPCPETTLGEMARTLRGEGRFVLADPVRREDDETDFINRFQELRRDGHVRMHRFGELIDLVSRHGFELIDSFSSSISFGRQRTQEYDGLLASTPTRIHEAYALTVAEEEIRMTFRILNAAFLNRNPGP
jgi:ubiquinone/menaquinone biosynthesis C-methylase UbiE